VTLPVLLSFCATLLAILALRPWAYTIGLVDRPSSLKPHDGHIPLVGGLGIAVSLLLPSSLADPIGLPLAVASLIVVCIGTLDDLRSVPALPRIMCQVCAAVIMVDGAKLVVTDFGDLLGTGNLHLERWGDVLTVFCVVGVMNAMNMIDGLDGLAGGIAAVALFWLGLAAMATGLDRAADLATVLFAAITGFLLFNLPLPWRPRASVFLGDAGSVLLGLMLAWCAVDLSQNMHHRFYAISTVWILGVPLMDTVHVILRRLVLGRSPFRGDLRHVHHTIVAIGCTRGQALAMLVCLSTLYGAIGYFGWRHRVPESVLFYGFLGAFALYCLVMEGAVPLLRARRAAGRS
jgi:UDP-GlcNAc:undecaprenyl-phosphate GlcNAc-1-phosphate transferase